MKKQGFTLIELLAVIVILAIIALIAVPMVLNTIESSRKGSASTSTYSYVSEVETKLATYMLHHSGASYSSGKYSVEKLKEDLDIKLKGSTPTEGNICIGDAGLVTEASIKMDGYIIHYDGKNATTTDLKEIEDISCDGTTTPETPGGGGVEPPIEPEVPKVELKDASDAVKIANDYIGEVDELSTASGYITASINGTREGHLVVDQILYFPTEMSIKVDSNTTYTYIAGYYKVTSEVSLPSYMNFKVIAVAGSTQTGYDKIEYLGESYLVNVE